MTNEQLRARVGKAGDLIRNECRGKWDEEYEVRFALAVSAIAATLECVPEDKREPMLKTLLDAVRESVLDMLASLTEPEGPMS